MANWLYNGVELPALYLWGGADDNYPYAIIWKTKGSDTYRFAMTKLPLLYDADLSGLKCDQAVSYYAGYQDESAAMGWSWSSDGVLQPGSYWSGVESVLWSSADVLTPAGAVYLAGSRPVSVNCDLRVYGGAELQKLPEVSGYPYVAILRNEEENRYEAVFSANGFYIKSSGPLCDKQGSFNQRYTVDVITAQVGAGWSRNDPYPLASQWPLSDALSLIWANHNILREDGTLYLPAVDPILVASKLTITLGSGGGGSSTTALYNGAELPALPGDISTLPYAYINTAMGGSAALLYLCKVPFVYNGSGLRAASGTFAMYMYDPQGIAGTPLTDWTFQTDGLGETVVDQSETQWANHDIANTGGGVYLTGSEPETAGGSAVTADSAALDFTCTGLSGTDKVYGIRAWVYPRGGSRQNPVAVYASPAAFGGPEHTESHTFTALAPATEYEVYGVITANGVATDHNALLTFATAEGTAVPTLALAAVDVSGSGFCLLLTPSGLESAGAYAAEVLVYNAATSKVAFEQTLSLTGNGTESCLVTGLEPLTEYGVSVDVYPASGGANVVRGDLTVTTGEETTLGIYVGVADLARAVESAYIGVGGVARAVKSVYVGVNGVARALRGS